MAQVDIYVDVENTDVTHLSGPSGPREMWLYRLRVTELVFLQGSNLMGGLMHGLYIYSAIAAGTLLALSIWARRRYDVSLSTQIEIAFYFGGFLLWAGAMISLYGSFQAPNRIFAQQNGKLASAGNTSNKGATFERPFGAPRHSGPVIANMVPESGVLGDARNATSGPLARYDRWTAVYDISAHTVYLPNGTRLEAHSGLGARLDDPRHVHERMRGATPPDIYELAPREQLFHGVQALRLKPVGAGNLFGRAGLLAHTYMLGPNGDSNGCVVFKNYDAFLQAFQNGEVKRLVVVAHLD